VNREDREEVVIHSNHESKEYFFSIDHLQPVPEGFVPTTFRLPHPARPREDIPFGWVETKEDVATAYFDSMNEVPNPDDSYRL